VQWLWAAHVAVPASGAGSASFPPHPWVPTSSCLGGRCGMLSRGRPGTICLHSADFISASNGHQLRFNIAPGMFNESRVTITLLEMGRKARRSSWDHPWALARDGRMEWALVALLQSSVAYRDPLNKVGGSELPRMSPSVGTLFSLAGEKCWQIPREPQQGPVQGGTHPKGDSPLFGGLWCLRCLSNFCLFCSQ